jgi:dUTP pyrophosphatase
MKIRYKKLSNKAFEPIYSTDGAAGLDLRACAYKIDPDNHYIEYFTGIALEIPDGHVGLVFPRSSISKKELRLANAVGVIDSDYRGEIILRFKFPPKRFWASLQRYELGDRIGQIIILPYPRIEFEEVDELSDTVRADGGFGSTGN